jgi:tRNA(fMet)-specific endonuclease VapC
MPYLLDTDVIINALAGRSATVNLMATLIPDGFAVSLITLGEIYEHAFRSVNPRAYIASFREFLAPYKILELNESIVERFAEIRSDLRRREQLISDLDILVGATATVFDLTLLTYNRRHFERIPDLRIYNPR